MTLNIIYLKVVSTIDQTIEIKFIIENYTVDFLSTF